MADAFFRMSTYEEYQLLSKADQDEIRTYLSGVRPTKDVCYIQLQGCRGDLRIAQILTITVDEERNYLDSGGIWHHMAPATYLDIINGNLR